ncbi:hypothetical protein BC830DRAFT_1167826 [Chytriomyces sp. MP71]|nr:hypothetical protein BC830DRAFT_1167826 [Chytriomyces sp. MP71]
MPIVSSGDSTNTTPVAWLYGSDNWTAAVVVLCAQWAAVIVHLAAHSGALIRLSSLSSAKATSKRRAPLQVFVHKSLNWSMALHPLGTVVSPSTLFPPLSIIAILLAFSLGTNLDAITTSDTGHQRIGRFAVAYLSITLSLPTRNSIITTALNVPFHVTLTWHTWIGSAAVLLAVTHAGAYFNHWLYISITVQGWVQTSLSNDLIRNQYGLGAVCLLAFMFLSSLYPVRRYFYHIFHVLHILCGPIALALIYLHSPTTSLPYLTAPLAFYIVDKLLRLIKSVRRVRVLDLATSKNESGVVTTFMSVCAPPLCHHHGFRAGQFVFVNVPEINSIKWHPVSLASSPNRLDTSSTQRQSEPTCCAPSASDDLPVVASLGKRAHKLYCGCTLVFSGRGPFAKALSSAVTERLLYPELPSLIINLDGPYGTSLAQSFIHDRMIRVYLAGGVGVTPILSMILANTRSVRETAGIGATETAEDRVQLSPVPLAPQAMYFVWSVRHLRDVEWALSEVRACAAAGAHVAIHVTRETSVKDSEAARADAMEEEVGEDGRASFDSEALLASWLDSRRARPGGQGDISIFGLAAGQVKGVSVVFGKRPDFGAILQDVKSVADAKAVARDCAVVVSGPCRLVSDVKRSAWRESDTTCLFHVFTESFEL